MGHQNALGYRQVLEVNEGRLGGGGVCAGVPGKLKSEDGGGNGDGGEDGGMAAISAGFRR